VESVRSVRLSGRYGTVDERQEVEQCRSVCKSPPKADLERRSLSLVDVLAKTRDKDGNSLTLCGKDQQQKALSKCKAKSMNQ
jgi:hypothetical protein